MGEGAGVAEDGEPHHQRGDTTVARVPRERVTGAFTPAQVAAIRARAEALGYPTATALARAVGVMGAVAGTHVKSSRLEQASGDVRRR